MEDLTLRQLESLAIDYFECRLSRQQEADLRKVLLVSTHTSQLLDECRLAIGLEATVKHAPRLITKTPLKWLRVTGIAAAVAMVASVGGFLATRPSSPSSSIDEIYAEVYVGGQRVTDKATAMAIADRTRSVALARKDSLMRHLMGEQARSISEMNRLIDKLNTTATKL